MEAGDAITMTIVEEEVDIMMIAEVEVSALTTEEEEEIGATITGEAITMTIVGVAMVAVSLTDRTTEEGRTEGEAAVLNT
jgi:hypothetical protein